MSGDLLFDRGSLIRGGSRQANVRIGQVLLGLGRCDLALGSDRCGVRVSDFGGRFGTRGRAGFPVPPGPQRRGATVEALAFRLLRRDSGDRQRQFRLGDRDGLLRLRDGGRCSIGLRRGRAEDLICRQWLDGDLVKDGQRVEGSEQQRAGLPW